MKFGCHLSIRNGYLSAAKEALSINARAFQYFPKNPRSLVLKDFSQEDCKNCKSFCEEHHIESVAHSPYPTDLAPPKEKQEAVVNSLLNDLEIAEACGSIGVVVHFAKKSSNEDPIETYKSMIETINRVLESWKGDCQLLLENNASKTGLIGIHLEEFIKIRELSVRPDAIGFCLDTCHAFASGLWEGDNWKTLLKIGRDIKYFEHLKAIHFNNSKYDMGESKDRHANIFHGGFITPDNFDDLMQSKELKDVPFILETPKETITHQDELQELYERWG